LATTFSLGGSSRAAGQQRVDDVLAELAIQRATEHQAEAD
jgi:hypothetical protein